VTEGVALVVTIVGLLLLVPPLGGEGAAIASLAAYTVNLLALVVLARRRFGGSVAHFLLPRPADARAVAHAFAGPVRRILHRGAPR
jgi:peptidoglycan biosynthesis protein MviN/MurJ (putative lipid II flippase)